MPADLFRSVVVRRRSSGRRFGAVPLSVAFHAALLVAVVTIPLIAITNELPAPHVPGDLAFEQTPVVVVPTPPPPPSAHRNVLLAPAATYPSEAPAGIPQENLAARAAEEIPQLRADDVIEGITSGKALEQLEPAPPPPPKPATPLRISDGVAAPRKIHNVAPVYPQVAVIARVEGTVVIEAVISATGTVQDARVVRSVPLLDLAALEAVLQWVFTPTRLNGEPVPVILTVNVEFKLR